MRSLTATTRRGCGRMCVRGETTLAQSWHSRRNKNFLLGSLAQVTFGVEEPLYNLLSRVCWWCCCELSFHFFPIIISTSRQSSHTCPLRRAAGAAAGKPTTGTPSLSSHSLPHSPSPSLIDFYPLPRPHFLGLADGRSICSQAMQQQQRLQLWQQQ